MTDGSWGWAVVLGRTCVWDKPKSFTFWENSKLISLYGAEAGALWTKFWSPASYLKHCKAQYHCWVVVSFHDQGQDSAHFCVLPGLSPDYIWFSSLGYPIFCLLLDSAPCLSLWLIFCSCDADLLLMWYWPVLLPSKSVPLPAVNFCLFDHNSAWFCKLLDDIFYKFLSISFYCSVTSIYSAGQDFLHWLHNIPS